MASTRVNSRWNCARPRRYCTRRGARRFHRHPPGSMFAEREGSHEVRNRCLERHCVDCGLSCALSLCSQRFDHVEIMACLASARSREVGSFLYRLMSVLGHERTLKRLHPMSALPPNADITAVQTNVRFVPKADILRCGKKLVIRSPRRRERAETMARLNRVPSRS